MNLLLFLSLQTFGPVLAAKHPTVAAPSTGELSDFVTGAGRATFAPGLRTLTFFDHKEGGGKFTTPPPRERFLKRLRAGLYAEKPVREAYSKRRRELLEEYETAQETDGVSIADEEELLAKCITLQEEEEKDAERAFNIGFQSIKDVDKPATKATTVSSTNSDNTPTRMDNRYQFVGVIDPSKKKFVDEEGGESLLNGGAVVQWYARKKPKKSNWSFRVVHVDRAAIFHELYSKNRLDFYSSYRSIGRNPNTGKVLVKPTYTARPRAWYTLWNFNILDYFTTRSGNRLRDRRLPNGLYTDGRLVYQTSYDYNGGRVGMMALKGTDLNKFLEGGEDSATISEKEKVNLEKRLDNGAPDIVSEF